MAGTSFISSALDSESKAVEFLDNIAGLSAFWCRRCEALVVVRDGATATADDDLECPVCRTGPEVGQHVTVVGGQVVHGVVEGRAVRVPPGAGGMVS